MSLKIIGTSHIARQSLQEIKQAFAEEKPEIVALELDAERASALFQDEKRALSFREILKVGLKGYLFARVGQYIQQKLGRIVGVSPGAEMKMAWELAKKHHLSVALIDQPFKVTLKRFSRELTWREKFRFLGDLLQGLLFSQRQLKKMNLNHFDLRKVPEKEIIGQMLKELRERYSSVYRTLVEERNKYMVKGLVKIMRQNQNKKILVVVGAGHVEGMEELLLKVDVF